MSGCVQSVSGSAQTATQTSGTQDATARAIGVRSVINTNPTAGTLPVPMNLRQSNDTDGLERIAAQMDCSSDAAATDNGAASDYVLDPAEPTLACSLDRKSVFVLGPQLIVAHTRDVNAYTGSETPTITVTFTSETQKWIADYTGAHVGERIAWLSGGAVIVAPAIAGQISTPSIEFSGQFTPEQVETIATAFRQSR